jgi:hypothetical protein
MQRCQQCQRAGTAGLGSQYNSIMDCEASTGMAYSSPYANGCGAQGLLREIIGRQIGTVDVDDGGCQHNQTSMLHWQMRQQCFSSNQSMECLGQPEPGVCDSLCEITCV